MRREHWICLALALVTLLVYARVAGFDYVNFDDPPYITDNPQVTGGLSADGLRWAFTTGYQANWHPLTWVSLMLDSSLQGVAPRSYHLTNLVLHVVNTLLLFWVLRAMTGAVWRSALVAALFALHPLHVESVAWITERKDVLSMFWGLLAVWAYTAYARHGRPLALAAVLACTTLSLMAKAMFITMPFVLLLLDYWPLGRMRGLEPTPRTGFRVATRGRLALEKLPLLAVGIAVAAATVAAQGRYGAVTETSAVPRPLLAANALVSYVRYLGKAIWPVDLSILYPHPNMPGGTPWAAWQVAGAAIVLAAISFAVFVLRRHRSLTVGWLWYLGTLVPMIGVVQVGTQAMADRYTYLPLVGVFIMAAWGGALVLERPARGGKAARTAGANNLAWALGLAAVAGCAALAWPQVAVWRNSLTLGEHAVTVGPTGPKMHYNYALALSEAGRYAEAIPEYAATLRLKPDHAKAHNNLGRTLHKLGRLDDAAASIRRAVAIEPDMALAWVNLSAVLMDAGRLDEAIAARERALRLEPDNPDGHNNLGSLLGRAGRLDEAIAHFRTALRLRPDFPEARRNLQLAEQAKARAGEAR